MKYLSRERNNSSFACSEKSQRNRQKAEINRTYDQIFDQQPILDVRDIRIAIRFDDLIDKINNAKELNQNLQQDIRKWLIRMYEAITSDAFAKYNQKQLEINQAKAYAAKNYIYNILNFIQSFNHLSDKVVQNLFVFVDKESKQIVQELIHKYPQSSSKSGKRRLKKVIGKQKLDYRESDEFDLFINPQQSVSFQYKESGNYSSEIMKALNYIMQISTKPLHTANQFQTNFDGFQQLLESIFNLAGDQSFQNQIIEKLKKYQVQENQYQKQIIFQSIFNCNEQNKQQKNNNKNYNQKAKQSIKQTHFQINQKIPNHVRFFDQKQIQSGIFRIPDASILRVMTKWVQQLKQKIIKSKSNILNKLQRFKSKKGELIQLKLQQKQILCDAIKQEQIHIKNVVKVMNKHFGQIGTKMCLDMPKNIYASEENGKVGVFAARSQNCVGKYLFLQLNQLIHSLLKVPIRAKKKILSQNEYQFDNRHQKQDQTVKQKANQVSQLSLITFKIGDLLRAKCQSGQTQIINIYNLINKINSICPKLLKIVRVKDRLDAKDNDLLINLFFMNKVQCQVQLQVNQSMKPKQKQFNSFNHFLYQLSRAQFGAIAESTCILAQHDPCIKQYTQRKQLCPKIVINFNKQPEKKQNVGKINDQEKNNQITKNLPSFCENCAKFNLNKNPYFYTKKVNKTIYKGCNTCYQKQLGKKNWPTLYDEILRQRSKDQAAVIQKHFDIVQIQKIKTFDQLKVTILKGLICSKNSQKPNLQYFESYDCFNLIYFYGGDVNKQPKIICKINPEENWKQALNAFIILIPKDFQNLKYQQQQLSQVQSTPCCSLLIHECGCCKTIILGRHFTIDQTIAQENKKLCRDFYYGLKWTFSVINRYITNQLQEQKQYQEMPFVKRFYGSQNSIRSMQFIKKFSNLVTLDMSQNYIQKIEGIKNLKFIQKINLSIVFRNIDENQITQIQNLDNLVNIKSINLGYNKIKQIKNLQKLPNLMNLNLQYNSIKSMKNLDKIKSLTSLKLNNNIIQKIENINMLFSLNLLNLNDNKMIKKIENINQLKNLKTLKLSSYKFTSGFNSIDSLKGIENSINLQYLQLQKNQINVISNLQKLINLKSLNLKNNKINRIQGLNNLVQLKFFNLCQNAIKQIQNIHNLSSLVKLNLGNNHKINKYFNQISQIKSLNSLVSLQILNLQRNAIKNIQNLSSLFSLSSLNISYNQLKQIKSLNSLVNLKDLNLCKIQFNLRTQFNLKNIEYKQFNKYFIIKSQEQQNIKNNKFIRFNSFKKALSRYYYYYLYYNKITKIQNLNNLVNLQVLSIQKNKIKEIENLQQLNSLKILRLQNNQIKKIKNIDHLTKLITLNLKFNEIANIQNLDKLISLKQLNLQYIQPQIENNIRQEIIPSLKKKNIQQNTRITKIKNLNKLSSLSILNLKKSIIKDIQNLDDLTKLQQLNLQGCEISQIKNLNNLTILKQLILDNNFISIIENLGELKLLQKLGLSFNQILKIQNLNLVSLKILQLANNKINKLQNLNHLYNLEKLYLGKNKIEKIQNLEKLLSLQFLNLSSNQINQISNLSLSPTVKQLNIQQNKLSLRSKKQIQQLNQNTSIRIIY